MSLDTDTEQQIYNLKEQIRKMAYGDLEEKVYVCFANGCLLLTSFLQKKGQPGWAGELINDTGEPILSKKEQETVEALFASAPWIWDMFATVKQSGGAADKQFVTGKFVKPIESLTGNDVSMDKMFNSLLKKTSEMDDYWTKFGKNSPGFAKMFDGEIKAGTFSIPVKPIVVFLITLIDSFRLSAALSGTQSHLLTLLVLIEEIITGQWRQMILTATGFISPTGTAIGIMFKYMVNAWMLINPSLRDEILRNAYKGSKSLLIGFILWAATTFTPMVLKVPIEKAFAKLREMGVKLEEQIKLIEEKGSEKIKATGKKFVFLKADFSKISQISLEDIQNLQSLAQWDFINCTKEFQQILTPIVKFPPFRLLVELLGVPTTSENKFELCRIPEPYPSLAETAKDKLEISIVNQNKEASSTNENKSVIATGGAKTKGKRMTRRVKVTKLS
jgi:hypothetical protein